MATGTAEHIDATTADAFIAEIWSKKALVARENTLIVSPLTNHEFKEELTMGDIVHVPAVSNLTVQTKDRSANAATIYETVTETNTDITVSTWHYSAVAIETATAKQVSQDLLARYAPKMGYALGLAIDDVLAGRPDDFTNAVGTLAIDLTYENVIRAVQYLDDADAPLEDRAFGISPAQREGFMALDQFVHADYSKLNEGVQMRVRAKVGDWMAIPVYMSVNVEGSNAAGHDNFLMHKEAIAHITQMTPTTHRQFDIDRLADKVVMEQLSGSAIMRNNHGVFMRGA